MAVPKHVALVMLAYALALAAACGDSGKKDREPTESAAPGPLVVYATEVRYAETAERRWPTLALVAYDLAAQREVSRFEAGAVGEYPLEVVLAAGMVVVNFEKRAPAFKLDGSGERTLIEAADRPGSGIGGFRVSPDGSMLAVTVYLGQEGVPGYFLGDPAIVILDAASGRVIRTSMVPAGLSAVIAWRADGSLVLAPPHGSGHYGVLHPDGMLREVVTGSYSLISPAGTYAATMTDAHDEFGLGCYEPNSEIIVRNIAQDLVIATIREESGTTIEMDDWSPDGSELLYHTIDDPLHPNRGCILQDETSRRWYRLHLPDGRSEPAADLFSTRREWYGDRYVEYRCNDAVVIAAQNCQNELMRAAPVEVYVGGALAGSGVEARVLGFVD